MSTSTDIGLVVLEPAAQAFVEATAEPPYLYQIPVADGRKAVDDVQSGVGVEKPAVDEEWVTVPGGPTGSVRVRIVRPRGSTGALPALLYVHGAGWVFGGANTHDRLVRELAVQAGIAVVFPEYDRAPEHRYPVQLEQVYATAQWVQAEGAAHDLDGTRLAIAGDSAGGNMAAAVTFLAKERGDVRFAQQVLFYPVTDSTYESPSYERFAEGYFLRKEAMYWFLDQYVDEAQRGEITASPLKATVEQLTGLPPAVVIVGEADVLRDEGEAYAAKLREAGVPVTATRYLGTIHDFVMLDILRDTHASRAATAQAAAELRAVLHG